MKTIYQPTEEELKELGFNRNFFGFGWYRLYDILYFSRSKKWAINTKKVTNIYPPSKQSIVDLISLFSK